MTPPRVTLPSMTFEERLVIHRAGREVHLLWVWRIRRVTSSPSSPGARDRDWRPDAWPSPVHGGRLPGRVACHIKGARVLEFDHVIPGHGSIQEGKSVLSQFRGYVEEITEKVSRGIERGQGLLDESKKTITPATLISLKVKDMSRRVEHELGALFPVPETPAEMLVASVPSNVQEVFTYFTQRKGKREFPLQ